MFLHILLEECLLRHLIAGFVHWLAVRAHTHKWSEIRVSLKCSSIKGQPLSHTLSPENSGEMKAQWSERYLLGNDKTLGTHSSYGCLFKTCTRSARWTLQHQAEKNPEAPTPCWGAKIADAVRRGKVRFSEYDPYTVPWSIRGPHTFVHTGNTNWTQWIISKNGREEKGEDNGEGSGGGSG